MTEWLINKQLMRLMSDTLMGIHGSVVAETQTVTRADIHKLSSHEFALEQQWFSLVKKRSLL